MALSEPSVDISELSNYLASIGSSHVDLVLIPPQALFHYTDLYGLIGIVEKHDLWLSHSRYSNDDEEMTYGLTLTQDAIKRAQSPLIEEYLNKLFNLTKEPEGVYICCFCETDDLLSQWRGYGANGTGVSLQFDPAQFSYVTGQLDNNLGLLRFWRVFYDVTTQKSILDQAIIHYSPVNRPGEPVDVLARKAADAIRFFIPTFKNAAFQEESEWRLLFTPSPSTPVKPRFRVSRNMLTPFYSLREIIGVALPQLPIRQVHVGPSVNKRLNRESVKALLSQNGYPAAEVLVSATPFRP